MKDTTMELRHKEITEAIIGSAFEVYNVLGKVAKAYVPGDEPQLLNELKATGVKVGLLINFGQTKVEFKRMVF